MKQHEIDMLKEIEEMYLRIAASSVKDVQDYKNKNMNIAAERCMVFRDKCVSKALLLRKLAKEHSDD